MNSLFSKQLVIHNINKYKLLSIKCFDLVRFNSQLINYNLKHQYKYKLFNLYKNEENSQRNIRTTSFNKVFIHII